MLIKPYSEKYLKNHPKLEQLNKLALGYFPEIEGNILYDHPLTKIDAPFSENFYPKRHNLWRLAQLSQEVMEIGFCAGHSSLLMFLANPSIKLTVFDIAYHKYTRPCYYFIKERFQTAQVFFGNSIVGVPGFIREYPGHTFDLIHIDGSHEAKIVEADYQNSLRVSHPGTYIVFDDTNTDNCIDLIIKNEVKAGKLYIVDRFSLGLLRTSRHEIAIVR
jgi:hypothetical protein